LNFYLKKLLKEDYEAIPKNNPSNLRRSIWFDRHFAFFIEFTEMDEQT